MGHICGTPTTDVYASTSARPGDIPVPSDPLGCAAPVMGALGAPEAYEGLVGPVLTSVYGA